MAEETGVSEKKPDLEDPKAELEKLRADNAALKAQVEGMGRPARRGGFWRSFLVWVLIILASLFSLAGVLSAWVRTTTLDTNTFVNTIAPLVKNEDVAKAVSEIAVDELFKAYEVESRIEDGLDAISKAILQAVPPGAPIPDDVDISFIAGPVTSGLESVAKTTAKTILQSDAFYKAWSGALRLGHETAVDIIRGDQSAAITSEGDTVVLNLTPLLDEIKASLVDAGLTFLEKIPVPKGIGQFELFTAEQLGAVKSMVRLLDLMSWVFPLLAFIFFALAVVVAKDRRRALMGAGIALAVSMLLVLVVLRVSHNQLLDQIKRPDVLAAADVVWGSLLAGLKQAVWGLLAIGAVTAIGSAFAGPYKWAVWVREHTAAALAKRRERRASGEGGAGPVAEFVGKYAWWFRAGGIAVALLVLLLLPTVSGLAVIITVVVLGLYMVLVELLR